MIITAYHGTDANFEKFDSKYMGTHGTNEGYGFYFATDKNIARTFGSILYTCELDIKKAISNHKKTIKKPMIAKIISYLNELSGGEYLTNYGDVDYEGYNKVFGEAVNSVYNYCDTDTEMFGDLVSANGGFENVANAFIHYGYNSMIDDNPDWGVNRDYKIIVMFDNNDIKILRKDSVVSESFISLSQYLYKPKGW